MSKHFEPRVFSFERDQIVAQLDATLSYDELKNADMVIEAVFEDIKVKHNVVKETEAVRKFQCKPCLYKQL